MEWGGMMEERRYFYFGMRANEKFTQMQMLMESCPGKTAVSGVMGFALGGAFGLFMASVSSPSFCIYFPFQVQS